MPWSSWRGQSPAGDGSWAQQGWTQPGAVLCCWEGFCLWDVSGEGFCSCFVCPRGNPRGAASTGWVWGDPRPLWEGSGVRLGRGGILLFQAIFAALGLCCLGGKDAGGGCCCCWQLLRSSAAGFPWLPNPRLGELSVCTDRGKPCCEGSSLEGSRKIPVLLLVSVGLFVSFLYFFSSSFKRHVFL